MIYSLEGILQEKAPDYAVINCGGVGYLVSVSANTASSLPPVGERAFVYTVMSVKENGVDLSGFATADERDLYRELCTVSGVGAKVALSILSTFTPDRLTLLIAAQDSKSVTAAPGVGPRLAQRVVLELKDKVGHMDLGGAAASVASLQQLPAASEAVAALTSLGFGVAEASAAVSGLDGSLSTEELVAGALRKLAMR